MLLHSSPNFQKNFEMSAQTYRLRVKKRIQETPDAVTLVFEVPEAHRAAFRYKPGQYLTLCFELDGQALRRCYSMSSSPLEPDLAVTVKRLEGGRVSCHIHDHVKEGDEVEVLPPEGRFCPELHEDQKKNYYLFGAGSGITPLMSILKTVVEVEPQSVVYLLYGSRNEESIIFREELDRLQQRYEGQLFVEHTLSRPKTIKPKGIRGLFSKGTPTWPGKIGRIDVAAVQRFLEEHPPLHPVSEYYICGPGDMIDNVQQALLGLGIDKKYIHKEIFLNEGQGQPSSKSSLGLDRPARLIAHLDGQTIETEVQPGKTVLQTLLEQGHDPPYSCTAGACATCMAKVLKGKVVMEACFALEDDEVEKGYILTCQSHPETEELEVTYDV